MTTAPSSHRLTPDQKLALAVIRQAIEDANNPRLSLKNRLEASEFLEGERSRVWYRIARLDPKQVQLLAS